MQFQRYFLAPYTYHCMVSDYLVFLDLKSDRYVCLDREESRSIRTHRSTDASTSPRARMWIEDTGGRASAALQGLVHDGVLTAVCDAAYDPTETEVAGDSLTTVSKDLYVDFIAPRARGTTRDTLVFLYACMIADYNLRRAPIHLTVSYFQHERRRRCTHMRPQPSWHAFHTRIGVFNRLRTLYPRPYLCLFDSLAMLHFLKFDGMFPNWVFGVKMDPFAAHCWVQTADTVLNDSLDCVREFQPILVA